MLVYSRSELSLQLIQTVVMDLAIVFSMAWFGNLPRFETIAEAHLADRRSESVKGNGKQIHGHAQVVKPL